MQGSSAQPAHFYGPSEPHDNPPNPLDDLPLSPPRPAPDEPLHLEHSPSSSAGPPHELVQAPLDPPPPAQSLPEPQRSPRPATPARHLQPPLAAASSSHDDATMVELQAPAAQDDVELSSELSELTDSGDSGDDVAEQEDEDFVPAADQAGSTSRQTVWYGNVLEALERGLDLIPNLGTSRAAVKGVLLTRPQLLIEYVRRQTGEVRTAYQTRNRIAIVRHRNPHNVQLCRSLDGRSVLYAEVDRTDWDALLGPDKYPHVTPAYLEPPVEPPSFKPGKRRTRSSKADEPSKKRRRRERKKDKSRTSGPSASSRRVAPPTDDFRRVEEKVEPVLPPPGRRSPPRPTAPLPDDRPLSSSSRNAFLIDLTAFLSSFCPTRDHEPTARALLDLGVDSPAALVLLVALEPSSLELLYEHLRKVAGLGPLDVAWLKKVVGAAREEFAGRR